MDHGEQEKLQKKRAVEMRIKSIENRLTQIERILAIRHVKFK